MHIDTSARDHFATTVLSICSLLVNVATGFLIYPLIIENLSVTAVAVFGTLYSAKAMLDMGIGWINGSATKALFERHFSSEEILGTALLINSVYGIISLAFLYLTGVALYSNFESSFIFFGLSLFCTFINTVAYCYYTSRLQQARVGVYRLTQQFLFLIFVIYLYNTSLSELYILTFLLFLSSLMIVFPQALNFNSRIPLKSLQFSTLALRKLTGEDGRRYLSYGIVIILVSQADLLLFTFLSTPDQTAEFILYWKIPATIITLVAAVGNPLQARFAKLARQGAATELFRRSELIFFVLGSVVAIVYFGLVDYLNLLWLGDESIYLTTLQKGVTTLAIFLLVMQKYYISAVYYSKNIRTVTAYSAIELIAKLIFFILLVDSLEMSAPILGWVVAMSILAPGYRRLAVRNIR